MSTIIAHHSSTVPSTTPILWLKSDKGITLDVNNKVSLWENQGSLGSTHDAIQNTESYRPLYVSNVLNGKPVLRFDALYSQYINIPEITFTDNQSVFVLYKNIDFMKEMSAFGYYDIGTHGLIQQQGILYSGLFSPLTYYNTGDITDWVIISNLSINHTLHLYINGVKPSINGSNGSINYQTYNCIGRASGQYNTGDIAEIIVYNQALSDEERITVENYLKNKYAII